MEPTTFCTRGQIEPRTHQRSEGEAAFCQSLNESVTPRAVTSRSLLADALSSSVISIFSAASEHTDRLESPGAQKGHLIDFQSGSARGYNNDDEEALIGSNLLFRTMNAIDGECHERPCRVVSIDRPE
jgi:hypothetical protein